MTKRRSGWLLMLGLLGCAATLTAQQGALTAVDVQPFEGEWILDSEKSGVSDPERRVITLGEGWVRVEMHRPEDQRPPTLIYLLNGSSNTTPFGSGTATTQIRRERAEIVTVAVITINDRPVTVEERLNVASSGEMVAAVTLRVEHGYQGVLPPLEKRAPNVAQNVKYFRRTK
jgi:hypothetical protein